jgi:hypothetical protein
VLAAVAQTVSGGIHAGVSDKRIVQLWNVNKECHRRLTKFVRFK